MKLILASNNPGKLTEMRDILAQLGVQVISQREAGLNLNPEETGETFEENARIKAVTVCKASGLPAIADDSGLMVDALNGAPGVYSARYGGNLKDDKARYELLLQNLKGMEDRRGKFVSVIACAFPDGTVLTARGECCGKILTQPHGNGGFGYDPVFYVETLEKSMGEMTAEEKNAISHRGQALRRFVPILREYLNKMD